MAPSPHQQSPGTRGTARRLIQAGLLTGVVDGLFSSVLSAVFYGSTVARLFQGVAATLVGNRAVDGGLSMTLLGVLMHFGVAFAWSAVFLLATMSVPALRRAAASWPGTIVVAALYGPLIWMVMSLVVIPVLTGRPTPITVRWWIQFFGHIPFVALPIVASIGSIGASREVDVRQPPADVTARR